MQVTWPLVALVGLVIGGIVALLAFIPEHDNRTGQVLVALLAGLSTLLGSLYTTRRVRQDQDQGQDQADR